MKNIEPKFRRIVIKVGSNVITGNDGSTSSASSGSPPGRFWKPRKA